MEAYRERIVTSVHFTDAQVLVTTKIAGMCSKFVGIAQKVQGYVASTAHVIRKLTKDRYHELPQASWWRHQMETFTALLALCAGIHRSPVNSPHKGQWRGGLIFSLIYAWTNGWINNRFETPLWSLWRKCNGDQTGKGSARSVRTLLCFDLNIFIYTQSRSSLHKR